MDGESERQVIVALVVVVVVASYNGYSRRRVPVDRQVISRRLYNGFC